MSEEPVFNPDWLSAPGESILDLMGQREISILDLAREMGEQEEIILDLVSGTKEITSEIANKLEQVIGGSNHFWLSRDKRYRDGLRKLRLQGSGQRAVDWIKTLPISDMTRWGWVSVRKSHEEIAAECMQFFGINSVQEWQTEYQGILKRAAFRTSVAFKSTPAATAAWLRQGEILSGSVACNDWNAEAFIKLLNEARGLSREKNPEVFYPRLQRIFSECGVAVVIVRAPSGCFASGAARFLTPKKALLMLSFRYLSDDQFWFSLFHEAGHLFLHGDRLCIDESTGTSGSEEMAANNFAADILVPPESRGEMLRLPIDGRSVMRFAKEIGISPGIVVGQLQHLKRLNYKQLSNLKRRYRWRDS